MYLQTLQTLNSNLLSIIEATVPVRVMSEYPNRYRTVRIVKTPYVISDNDSTREGLVTAHVLREYINHISRIEVDEDYDSWLLYLTEGVKNNV